MTDPRAFRCRDCGNLVTADTKIGPLPTRCDACDPEGAERRRQKRASGNASTARRRRETDLLKARIYELEQILAFDQEAERHGRSFADPGRADVGRAVRALAHAEGRDATREALLTVAAACRAWARVLAEGAEQHAHPDQEQEAA